MWIWRIPSGLTEISYSYRCWFLRRKLRQSFERSIPSGEKELYVTPALREILKTTHASVSRNSLSQATCVWKDSLFLFAELFCCSYRRPCHNGNRVLSKFLQYSTVLKSICTKHVEWKTYLKALHFCILKGSLCYSLSPWHNLSHYTF